MHRAHNPGEVRVHSVMVNCDGLQGKKPFIRLIDKHPNVIVGCYITHHKVKTRI